MALAVATVNAQLIEVVMGSALCVENYANYDVDWYMMNASSYATQSASVSTAPSATTCESLSSFINGGAQQNFDYQLHVSYTNPSDSSENVSEPVWPFIEYSSDGPSITYVCGMQVGQYGDYFCCCNPGNPTYYCEWTDTIIYSECISPASAVQQ